MESETADAVVAMEKNKETEDLNHVENGSPVDEAGMVRNASYWEEIDQEEIERVRRYDICRRIKIILWLQTRCFIMYDFREVFYTMCSSRYP